mmetsp:Transcript_42790/g.138799  ORF Transcript_42790/g.138799 Transcript_42790/m.138799 type:complete len:230 (-) Transcript_42790:136-825(-)
MCGTRSRGRRRRASCGASQTGWPRGWRTCTGWACCTVTSSRPTACSTSAEARRSRTLGSQSSRTRRRQTTWARFAGWRPKWRGGRDARERATSTRSRCCSTSLSLTRFPLRTSPPSSLPPWWRKTARGRCSPPARQRRSPTCCACAGPPSRRGGRTSPTSSSCCSARAPRWARRSSRGSTRRSATGQSRARARSGGRAATHGKHRAEGRRGRVRDGARPRWTLSVSRSY